MSEIIYIYPHISIVLYSLHFSSFKSGHFFSTYVNPFIIFLGVAFPAMNLFRFLFCFQLHKVFSLCLYRYVGQ